MYEKSALLTNTTGDLSILAGATFGGGTTINWACCIPTPEHVRKEWADTQGVHRWAVGCSRVVLETVLYSIFWDTMSTTHRRFYHCMVLSMACK